MTAVATLTSAQSLYSNIDGSVTLGHDGGGQGDDAVQLAAGAIQAVWPQDIDTNAVEELYRSALGDRLLAGKAALCAQREHGREEE